MGIFITKPVSRHCQSFVNTAFTFLLVINVSATIILYYNLISSLDTALICRSQAAPSPSEFSAGIADYSHTYPGAIPRTFFADVLRGANVTVKTSNEKYSLLNEANFQYNENFLYLKEPDNDYLTQAGVSLVHQLHCLGTLNHTIERLQDRRWKSESGELDIDMEHVAHCFDYIAQGIACSGDDTLERSHLSTDPLTGKPVRIVHGMGTIHQCRDTSLVQKALVESRISPLIMSRDWEDGDTLGSLFG